MVRARKRFRAHLPSELLSSCEESCPDARALETSGKSLTPPSRPAPGSQSYCAQTRTAGAVSAALAPDSRKQDADGLLSPGRNHRCRPGTRYSWRRCERWLSYLPFTLPPYVHTPLNDVQVCPAGLGTSTLLWLTPCTAPQAAVTVVQSPARGAWDREGSARPLTHRFYCPVSAKAPHVCTPSPALHVDGRAGCSSFLWGPGDSLPVPPLRNGPRSGAAPRPLPGDLHRGGSPGGPFPPGAPDCCCRGNFFSFPFLLVYVFPSF